MSEKTFLVEIGTEELPPKALRSLAESFAANFTAELDNAGLAHGTVQWFAAPRRLALKVANLAEAQPDREIEKRGPAIAQAFDAEGKPSKAAEGWARGCGITVDQAERLTTDKGEWLLYRAHVKGESTEALLPNMVATSLAKLPIPKLMRWGASDVHFVRPVHTVTLLLGDKVIPATILGIQSDRVIRGHRFMGEPEFTIDNADQYPEILRERGKVWRMPSSSSIPTVKNVWKITCRACKPCCSSNSWVRCATKLTASRRWLAGLLNRLALTLTTQPVRACCLSVT